MVIASHMLIFYVLNTLILRLKGSQRFGSFKACSSLHLDSVLNLRLFGECEVTFRWVGFKSLLSWDVSDEIHILIAKWWASFSVSIQNQLSGWLSYVLVMYFVLNICSVNIGRWATCCTRFNGILWAVVIHRFSHTIGTDVVIKPANTSSCPINVTLFIVSGNDTTDIWFE